MPGSPMLPCSAAALSIEMSWQETDGTSYRESRIMAEEQREYDPAIIQSSEAGLTSIARFVPQGTWNDQWQDQHPGPPSTKVAPGTLQVQALGSRVPASASASTPTAVAPQ